VSRQGRVEDLVGAFRALGESNGRGEEYMSALTVAMGLYLRKFDPDMRLLMLGKAHQHLDRIAWQSSPHTQPKEKADA
jgi:hypothetical protein